MQIWVADVDASAAPATRTSAQLETASGVYPCTSDSDCPGQEAGACVLASGICSGVRAVEGYLPRLIEHPTSPGRALFFSHATCNSGYGSECTATSTAVDYDLVVGRLQSGTNSVLDAAHFVANAANVQELDAFATGDIFGVASVYYVGLTPQSLSVLTEANGSQPITLPVSSFYKVGTSFSAATSKWTTTSAPVVIVSGEQESLPAPTYPPTPCRLGGVADMVVTSSWRVRNPVHVVMSPNRRYLAYALSVQELECVQKFTLGTPEDELRLGAPSASDIYVIDTLGSGVPTPVYDPSCVGTNGLGAINLMPTFIAGGEQLVFSSSDDAAGTGLGGRFFRFNLRDLDAASPGCDITPVVDTSALLQALTTEIAPTLVPIGASLVDSRTYVAPSCNCQSASGDAYALLVLGTLGWVVTRRRRRLKVSA